VLFVGGGHWDRRTVQEFPLTEKRGRGKFFKLRNINEGRGIWFMTLIAFEMAGRISGVLAGNGLVCGLR
jgi:hypothetical protein